MKRTVKFRGKRYNGNWIFGSLIDYNDGTIPMIANREYGCEHIIPETVGQFTRLRDKNGKEIYEGDILICNSNPLKGFIEWNKILCQFQCTWNNKLGAADIYHLIKYCNGEVIGNIHDNPELLT